MRLSELLGVRVTDSTGKVVGGLADLVLDADLHVTGMIVVERRHVRLLGYERNVRPALFQYVVRLLAGEVYNVPWSHVGDVTPEGVRLRVDHASLEAHDRSMRE